MSDSLILQLEPYDNRTWYFDKEKILSLFPESLLARTVDLDSSAELIPIPNDDVTPDALDYLQGLIREDYPDPPRTTDTISTGKYLGIDLLIVVGDASYATFALQNPVVNLLHLEELSQVEYRRILEFTIKADYPSLANYVLDRTDPSVYHSVDNTLLIQASFVGRVWLVKRLLQRGIDPKAVFPQADPEYSPIATDPTFDELTRVDPGYYEDDKDNEFYSLLNDIVDFSGYYDRSYPSLFYASYAGQQSVVEVLVQQANDSDLSSAFQMAITGDQLGLIQWLAQYPLLSPKDQTRAFNHAVGLQINTSVDTWTWILTNVQAIRSLDMNHYVVRDIRDPMPYNLNLIEAIISDQGLLATLDEGSIESFVGIALEENRPDLIALLEP